MKSVTKINYRMTKLEQERDNPTSQESSFAPNYTAIVRTSPTTDVFQLPCPSTS